MPRTRLAIVHFNNNSKVLANFTSPQNYDHLKSLINNIQYANNSSMNLSSALKQANDEIFQEVNGMRPLELGVPKVILLIIVGNSLEIDKAINESAELKTRGVSIITLGIGNSFTCENELVQIASSREDSYRLYEFNKIEYFLNIIAQTLKNQPAQITFDTEIESQVEKHSPKNFFINFSKSKSKIICVHITSQSELKCNHSFDSYYHLVNDQDLIDPDSIPAQPDGNFNEIIPMPKQSSQNYEYEINIPDDKHILYLSISGSMETNGFKIVISQESDSTTLNEQTTQTDKRNFSSSTFNISTSTTIITTTTTTKLELCKVFLGEMSDTGFCTSINNCLGAGFYEICENIQHVCCVIEQDSITTKNESPILKKDTFLKLVGSTPRNNFLYSYFAKSIHDANATNEHKIAAYLSTLVQGTEFFKVLEYTEADDAGSFYKGRGGIFIKGKVEYGLAGEEINVDLIRNPAKAVYPSVAFQIASWYWRKYGLILKSKDEPFRGDLNELVDGTFFGFTMLTHGLTKSLNDLKRRAVFYESVLKELNASIGKGRGDFVY